MRAYWEHWFKCSQSGKPFTFRNIGAFDEKESNAGTDTRGNKPKEARKSSTEEPGRGGGRAGGGDGGEGTGEEPPSGDLTPDQCDTDEAKISFLQSLFAHEQKYQAIIDCLAQMRVSYLYCFISRVYLQNISSTLQALWTSTVQLVASHGTGTLPSQIIPSIGGEKPPQSKFYWSGLRITHTLMSQGNLSTGLDYWRSAWGWGLS